MSSILFFYINVFLFSFFFCIPIGPVNLEVLQSAIRKQHLHALSIAFGAAIGDAVWALCAFYGISPFLKNRYLEGSFLLLTALITLVIGLLSLKDARFLEKIEIKEEQLALRIRRKRWLALKGFTLVIVNPLGIASWMIGLSFLRRLKIYIPFDLTYVAVFALVVTAGAMLYFSLIIFITNKMKQFFNPQRTRRVIKSLGYLLIAFSAYFFFNAGKVFLNKNLAIQNLLY